MAGFKAHISFGILTAIVFSSVLFLCTPIKLPEIYLAFFITIFSAMLPDIDSNSGIPVQIIFALLSLISMVLVFDLSLKHYNLYLEGAIAAVSAGALMFAGVQYAFKRLTSHRGAFHSVPMALIFGLITLTVLSQYKFHYWSLFTFMLAVVVGYLCHLVLDELNSAVNLSGKLFRPKKSLGSALKLTASTALSTAVMYMVLSYLLYINQGLLYKIFKLKGLMGK
ncbi:metal-dependent hydrolase [Candidatus Comchoanobacter bicostacola]|uniref:Metal-dependent hydrolase n=1 Tax=Candidatus Comchoanobacter bicostacola TaxID=2919598 RepID=A0ABY5DJK3_9GAMM|nr:metal-dependent hydrolase [Candidatus Comchoanobacter bicostacola]UTC24703.1 metal-dependent hydrolase [Candidatus Comchoanobacter bicostacola]